MDSITFAELQSMVACGQLDCMKGCCDNLALVQSVLSNKSDRDLALIRQLLCGCAIAPSAPKVDPRDPANARNTCFQGIINFVKAHKSSFNGLQILLTQAEGVLPVVGEVLAQFSSALELLEDAVDDAAADINNQTLLNQLFNGYCSVIGQEAQVVTKLQQQAGSPVIDALLSALNAIDPLQYVDRACCSNAQPTVVPTTPTNNNPVTPVNVPAGFQVV